MPPWAARLRLVERFPRGGGGVGQGPGSASVDGIFKVDPGKFSGFLGLEGGRKGWLARLGLGGIERESLSAGGGLLASLLRWKCRDGRLRHPVVCVECLSPAFKTGRGG